jgi:hypothetical protein
MSPENYGQLVLALLGAAVVAALWGWTANGSRIWAPCAAVLLAAAGLVAALPERVTAPGHQGVTALVVLAGALAVAGGGPVTARVFALVDRQHEAGAEPNEVAQAGAVLRGGAWIGALERAAVFVSLAAGQPEGVAVVLAVKGLGRYPELRTASHPGAAERFIIGTFTSVLWAAACAGVVRLVLA